MTVRFQLLGTVKVIAQNGDLSQLAPRHRAVLAYLLLHPRIVIGVDRLIEAIWGLTPPDTARAQIQSTVAAIRRALREAGARDLLATRPAGYVITPVPGQVDVEVFASEVAAAQALADSGAAVQRLRAALSAWRGRPLEDLSAHYVGAARDRLEDRRLRAFEQLAELELADGRHEQLIDELSAEVAEHPLRERLTCLLMLALHQSGRQVEALAAARAYRHELVERQGLDPGKAFVECEQAILRSAPVPARAAGRNFLPRDIPDFTGRATEVQALLGACDNDSRTISTVDGMPGIGKTTLAVHVANQLAERYPDGRLFVDLHAHAVDQPPTDPGTALELLLRQLGVAADLIPPATAARAALWRAELSGRRVLVVLDNAADTDHIRLLLPGATRSLMLVTSRRRLTDLDGAYTVSLEPLPVEDCVAMFQRIVGERAQADPVAVLDVVHLCGLLPLAVRIAGARLRHRPQWSVAYLADRLRDQRRRLRELSTAERGVCDAFTRSYQQLGPDQQRMFRLLSVHPGHDIEPQAAAALAAADPARAERLLEDLVDEHLLLQHQPGRYTLHDLLRAHARCLADAEEPPADRQRALTRLFDHYLSTAAAALGVDLPASERLSSPAVRFANAADAQAWVNAERANFIAVSRHAAAHGLIDVIGEAPSTVARWLLLVLETLPGGEGITPPRAELALLLPRAAGRRPARRGARPRP
ncbi:BTAD domain-containing putative transcriptional regulator [Nonomuraea sp. NPDC050536]|uniref:AfsR/SARP family transcriptional regulator n=1 Tax=Nonomuraea sp. NPDC050536 TaxID=3364366 RepID=UPI0037C670D9